jgi:hypothetical protein
MIDTSLIRDAQMASGVSLRELAQWTGYNYMFLHRSLKQCRMPAEIAYSVSTALMEACEQKLDTVCNAWVKTLIAAKGNTEIG